MHIFYKLIVLNCLIISTLSAFSTPTPKVQFIRNDGQWDAAIRFRAEIPGGYLLVKNTGLQYIFTDFSALHAAGSQPKNARQKPISGHSVDMQFVEANLQPMFENNQPSGATYNYFLGKDASKWKQNVPAFEEIIIRDIYPNIDFRLYGIDQSLKYEYVAKPHADISKIKMKYLGAESLSLDNQAFTIKTSLNVFKEFQPYSFQKIAGKDKEIKSNFRLTNNEIQFEFPENYDKTQTLTIDPQLVFATYSGSKSDNWGHTATYDSDGNLYAGGTVFGIDFPITAGAFQVAGSTTSGFNAAGYGITDVVVMKFSADGTKLLYSTFLGGKESDVPLSLVVNSKGELVIFGTTGSTDFPVSATAFQKTFGGGVFWANSTDIAFNNGSDVFVAVLSKNGDKLVGSTYVGGNRNDGFSDTRGIGLQNYGDEFRGEVNLDSLDNIYFVSTAASSNFPVKNASQAIHASGNTYDGVVCELTPNCSDLLWSTFIGGDGLDIAYGVKVAKSGSVYVCGVTNSINLGVKTGALNLTNAGKTDGFIAKFTKNALEQVTYLGTNQDDVADFVELDAEENVYIYGLTTGIYPVSAGVYRNDKSGQFIHCLDKNLSKTIFSTVFGTGNSSYDIVPTAFLVNACGNIYISGWGGKVDVNYNAKSGTKTLPISDDAVQKTTTGSNYYLAILEKGANSLLYATYFGASAPTTGSEVGDHLDGGTCRFDKNGIIYHAACSCKSRSGTTAEATFPVTANAYQKNLNSSNCNLSAFKIDLEGLKANFNLNNAGIAITEVCAPAKIDFANLSIGGKTYEWQIDGNVVSRTQNPTQVSFTTPGDYLVKLKIFNKVSCKTVDSTQRILHVKGFTAKVSRDTTICSEVPVQLKAEGGDKYVWTPTDFLDNSTIANPIAKVKSTTQYTVTVSKEGCDVLKSVTIKVDDSKPDFQVTQGKEICAGQPVSLQAVGGAKSFTWSAPSMKDTVSQGISVNPSQSTTYTVKATYSDGCKPIKTVTLTVDNSFKPDFDVNLLQDCNKPLQLVFLNKTQNADKVIWSMGNGDSLKTLIPDNYKYSKIGDYTISLTAYNKIGCKLTTSKTINIPDIDGKVPNVITPNGDGKNDLFVVGFKNATLLIYNRWGKLVFESKDYQNNWGNGVETGDYFYVLTTISGTECKGILQVIN